MPGTIIGLGEILWDLLPSGPRAGGAPFNFAFHCHQLGHPAIVVSRVGDDELGWRLRAEIRRLGMSDELIQIDPDRPTGTVQVQVDADGQPSYNITKDVAWDFLEWREEFTPLIRSAKAVCFGTLAQRNPASRQTIQRFLASSRGELIRIGDLNLRPPDYDLETIENSIRLADWLKVNEAEWQMIVGQMPFPESSEESFRRRWISARGPHLVCITKGERGCRVWNGDGEAVDIPGIPVPVADTVGAGDAFTAGVATQFLEAKPLAEAARFANALAALVASRPSGTPRIDRAEVVASLNLAERAFEASTEPPCST